MRIAFDKIKKIVKEYGIKGLSWQSHLPILNYAFPSGEEGKIYVVPKTFLFTLKQDTERLGNDYGFSPAHLVAFVLTSEKPPIRRNSINVPFNLNSFRKEVTVTFCQPVSQKEMEKIWLEVNKCFNIRDKPRTGKNLDEDDWLLYTLGKELGGKPFQKPGIKEFNKKLAEEWKLRGYPKKGETTQLVQFPGHTIGRWPLGKKRKTHLHRILKQY
jgi:hypothetical protein